MNDEDRTVRKLLAEHGDIKPCKSWLSFLELGPAEHQNFALALGLKCTVEATQEIVHKYCRQQQSRTSKFAGRLYQKSSSLV